jgi:hypothetical protein
MVVQLDVTDIIKEYLERPSLEPQDIVKCYLKMHKKAGEIAYDKKIKYYNLRPGDVVFIEGRFYPLLSYPRIDDTLRTPCVHMLDWKDRPRFRCTVGCRNWYILYKNDKGKVKQSYDRNDGLTTIRKDHVKKVLSLLAKHPDIKALTDHYLDAEHFWRLKNLVVSQLRSSVPYT